jgi:hypothetical protein
MNDLANHDLQMLDRFLDGAMSADEQAACRRRLEAEPELRAGLQLRKGLRRGFAAGRAAAFAPRPGFAEGVVAAARRLPAARADESVAATVRICRRLLLVAAALVAAALLWQSGLFRERGDGTLQAAPAEAQRIIDALDAKIHARTVDGRK